MNNSGEIQEMRISSYSTKSKVQLDALIKDHVPCSPWPPLAILIESHILGQMESRVQYYVDAH